MSETIRQMNKNKKRNLIVMQNIRSMSKNFDEFEIFYNQNENLLAITLTETWLNENKPDGLFQIDHFDFF